MVVAHYIYCTQHKFLPILSDAANSTPILSESTHSFHSLEAEKGPMSFTFGHTHLGVVETKSPPQAYTALLALQALCSVDAAPCN